jgi:hypothetical protein
MKTRIQFQTIFTLLAPICVLGIGVLVSQACTNWERLLGPPQCFEVGIDPAGETPHTPGYCPGGTYWWTIERASFSAYLFNPACKQTNAQNSIAWDRTQELWPWDPLENPSCKTLAHRSFNLGDINANGGGYWDGYEESRRVMALDPKKDEQVVAVYIYSTILRYNGLEHEDKNYLCPKYYQNLSYHKACDDLRILDAGPEDINEDLVEGDTPLKRVGKSGSLFGCSAFENG